MIDEVTAMLWARKDDRELWSTDELTEEQVEYIAENRETLLGPKQYQQWKFQTKEARIKERLTKSLKSLGWETDGVEDLVADSRIL